MTEMFFNLWLLIACIGTAGAVAMGLFHWYLYIQSEYGKKQ